MTTDLTEPPTDPDTESGASLVVRRGAAIREVVPLRPGQRLNVGRAASNQIVISDEKCSRQHCELFATGGAWVLRDLGSRNGTHVDGELVEEVTLLPGVVAEIGDWQLEISDDLGADLPADSVGEIESDSLVLVDRKTNSRFDRDVLEKQSATTDGAGLARMYLLAERLAEADDTDELARRALAGLLESTAAEFGVVTFENGTAKKPAAAKLPAGERLQPLVEYLSRIVRTTGDGCRFEDTNPGGLVGPNLPLSGAIAAPITGEDKTAGVIQLFSREGGKRLGESDLDFTITVAGRVSSRRLELLGKSELKDGLNQVEEQNKRLREQLRIETDLVGKSELMDQLRATIGRIARTEATVLIRGESGVGKELVARAVHFNSKRSGGPLVCVNCAALTESLLESELFGHEKGAFTGAGARKIGKFEMADGGTLFLDEVGEMPPEIQAKFLRVLEGHPFERVGGSTPIKVNVRVVCATNRDLERAVEDGAFRGDLFFRLHVIQIDIPPLRERFEDVPEIVQHFVERFRSETGTRIRGFSPDAMQRMMKYPWPGNVRELRNVVERAVILTDKEWIGPGDVQLSKLRLPGPAGETADEFRLPPAPYGGDPFPGFADEKLTLDEIERRYIVAVLEHTGWNKSAASRLLEIERTTLDRKIKKYDLQRPK